MNATDLSLEQSVPIYATTVILCIFYLANIVPIIYLRKSAFAPLIYENCIVSCIANAIAAMFICTISLLNGAPCFVFLWAIFAVAIAMGSNYLVKCVRIIIQTEWNYHYKGDSTSSEMSRRGSQMDLKKFVNTSAMNRFILKGIPLLRRKNSIIFFAISFTFGMLIPFSINVAYPEYRDHMLDMCYRKLTAEIIIIALIVSFYVVIFVVTIVFVMKRRKLNRNMFIVSHLKHIALAWLASALLLSLLNVIYMVANTSSSQTSYLLMTMTCNVVFIIPFSVEILEPQIHHFLLKRRMRDYEQLYDKIASLETMLKATFSKSVNVIMNDVEKGRLSLSSSDSRKKEHIKNVKSIYEYLRIFILQHQSFQDEFRDRGVDTEVLLKRLLFINIIRRRRIERGGEKLKSSDREYTLLPGHILELWQIFFIGEKRRPSFNDRVIIPEEFMTKKIREYFSDVSNRTRAEYVEYFLSNIKWKELYDSENLIGKLPKKMVRTIFRMENNFEIDDEDMDYCSNVLLGLYKESIDLLDDIVLPEFKGSSYFGDLIMVIQKDFE